MSWLPRWLRHYRRADLPGDVSAGVIVTLLLVPQGLAYALVAGLPPEAGLYASLLPLLLYAFSGGSHAQSVGPMAVTSLLVAATLSRLAAAGSDDYLLAAIWLALLSGAMLFLFGLLRLGFLADALSQPVLAGFTAASALLIVLSQLAPLAGFRAGGASLPDIAQAFFAHVAAFNPLALLLGLVALLGLVLARRYLAGLLHALGLASGVARPLSRTAPMLVVLGGLLAVTLAGWQSRLPVVGVVPGGLPSLRLAALPSLGLAPLVMPAFFIALINYVQSLSVAQMLAAPRRETIDPDRELLALGLCNLGAGLCGGFPVTGGLTRSVVNADAGANTQLASLITAALMVLLLSTATALLANLPLAVLAATIIASVAVMIDFSALRAAWRTERADAVAFAVTFLLVLALGVDAGIVAGVVISLSVWLMRSSRPHIAVLGRVPGTEHFRNVLRYHTEPLPGVLLLRVDESLFFGNARHVGNAIQQLAAASPDSHSLLLVMSAVNRLDMTALSMLERLDDGLAERGIRLHLAEVKGPVLDVCKRAGLAARFDGRLHLSTHIAIQQLCPGSDYQI
ncbi:SulP family inorganic anion transporter [Vogesella alkaliphila]|uniref:Sodium-independent anion transporter n=1 Tax=Vogesella alkaliphila TaxID=1193621 RepID=A0ABQ2YXZ3_9NEIS|nr:sulfate permease [Vogesella alkaliphila]GGX99054.1 sodium-independent anion transporter [Vogesella alkaliphila]